MGLFRWSDGEQQLGVHRERPAFRRGNAFQLVGGGAGLLHSGHNHVVTVAHSFLEARGPGAQVLVKGGTGFHQLICHTGKLLCGGRLVAAGHAQGFLIRGAAAKFSSVGGHGREDIMLNHINHGLCLNRQDVDIVFNMDFVTGLDFLLGVDAVLDEKIHVFRVDVRGQGVGGGLEVAEAPFCSFFKPCVIVAVAVEDDALMLGEDRRIS